MKKRIIPITDLRKTNEISKLVHDDQPIFITKNGYNDMVIMSDSCYEKLSERNSYQSFNEAPATIINKKIVKQSDNQGFINVAACSFDVKVGNIQANIESIKHKIDEALKNDVSLITFPELSITGYTCGDLFIQDVLIKQVIEGIVELKKYTKGKSIVIFVGAPIEFNDSIYNTSICIHNGKILGIMPKKYIPNYKEYYESRYFEGYNNQNSSIIIDQEEVPFGNKILFINDANLNEIISSEICEDAWAAHSPSLDQAEAGATMIFNLSASNETIDKDNVRKVLVREASRKLNCAYIYSSSSYEESTTDLIFCGENIICEVGDTLASSPLFYSNMIIATIDLERIKNKRRYVNTYQTGKTNDFTIIHYNEPRKKLDYLTNRNLSALPFIFSDFSLKETDYNKILKMQALALARRLKAINCKKVVLGLSGGLDSTLALLVCHEAFNILSLDKKGIICITLPCFGTSKRTYNNALTIANQMGNTLIEIDISSAVTQHLKDIDHENSNYDVTYENAQARERTKVLMDYANKVNGIVIGTGDLSEIALGWSTYNGDHMSMYAVNASIPKTLIRAMFDYFAHNEYQNIKEVLLDILDTPISPELIPSKDDKIDQKTEDLVGPYELHDFFLYHYMNDNYSFSKIYYIAKIIFKNKYTNETIKKWLIAFIRRFFTSQFKRSCMPDGCKVTSISLSPRGDLRLPSDISFQSYIKEIELLD